MFKFALSDVFLHPELNGTQTIQTSVLFMHILFHNTLLFPHYYILATIIKSNLHD